MTQISSNPAQAPATAERSLPDLSRPEQLVRDLSLEGAIDAVSLWLGTAKTPAERRTANDVLCRLVRMRSEGRVREMEYDLGLR